MSGPAHEEHRARLLADYGVPRPFPAAEALRLLGLRRQVHPRDVSAWAYRDQAAADAWAASNADRFGHPSLGTIPVDGSGVVGVLDLRPVLIAHSVAPTSPACADGWVPPSRRETW